MRLASVRSRRGALHPAAPGVGGSGEEHPIAVFHERPSDGGGEIGFSRSRGGAEEEEVGALAEPEVPRREGHHLGLGDHGDGGELEVGEALAGQQAGVAQMAFDPPAGRRSASSCSASAARKRAAGQPSASARSLNFSHRSFMVGQAQFAQHQPQLDPVHPPPFRRAPRECVAS